MPIPSPDQALVDAFDRIVAQPQRAGDTLPAVLYRIDATFPVLHLFATLGVALCGIPQATPASAAYGILGGLWVLSSTRRSLPALRADALAWGPGTASRYRAVALARRASQAAERCLFVIALGVLLAALANALAAPAGALPGILLPLGFLPLMSTLAAREYARCAMPRDPDQIRTVHRHA